MGMLSGKTAFVTGGGSGLGLACARAFVADGASILVMGRNEERLATAVKELESLAGHNEEGEQWVKSYSGTVTDESSVEAAVAAACGDGGLDIAVASAGASRYSPLLVTESSDWDKIMRTNLSGTFYTIKHAGRAMAKSGGGAICTISSLSAVRTHRFMSAYSASKAAIDMLVRNAADELGAANIRVNSVCPGLVGTKAASQVLDADYDAAFDDYRRTMPMRKEGAAEDVGAAVRFLCGPESSWITGTVLSVDGGAHLRRGTNIEPIMRKHFGDDVVDGRLA